MTLLSIYVHLMKIKISIIMRSEIVMIVLHYLIISIWHHAINLLLRS